MLIGFFFLLISGTKIVQSGGKRAAGELEMTAASVEPGMPMYTSADVGLDCLVLEEGEEEVEEATCEKKETGVSAPPHFMVRIPMYAFSDDKFGQQIRDARRVFVEKTQTRDALKATMEKKKEICKELQWKARKARWAEEAARRRVADTQASWRSTHSTLEDIRNRLSALDIDKRKLSPEMRNLKHRINHGKISLKQERVLAREINQLTQDRDKLPSDLAAEREWALGEQDWMEKYIENYKRTGYLELKSRKLMQAEYNANLAEDSFEEERRSLKRFQTKIKTAEDHCQRAHMHWQNLKRESIEKVKKKMDAVEQE